MEDIKVKHANVIRLVAPKPYSAKDMKNILETQGRGQIWKRIEKANGDRATLFTAHPNTTAAFIVELSLGKRDNAQETADIMESVKDIYGKTIASIFDNNGNAWIALVFNEENRKAKRYAKALTETLSQTLSENGISHIFECDGILFSREKISAIAVDTEDMDSNECHNCNCCEKEHHEKEETMENFENQKKENNSSCFSDMDTKIKEMFAHVMEQNRERVKKETKKMVKREITNGIGKALAFAAVNGQRIAEAGKSAVQDISKSYREEKNEMEKGYHQDTKEEHPDVGGFFDGFFNSLASEGEKAASEVSEHMDNMPHRKDEVPRLQGRENTYDLIMHDEKELVEAYYQGGKWFATRNNERINENLIIMYTKHND